MFKAKMEGYNGSVDGMKKQRSRSRHAHEPSIVQLARHMSTQYDMRSHIFTPRDRQQANVPSEVKD